MKGAGNGITDAELPPMFAVFERSLIPGQVYPCAAEDISAQLSRLPPEDLEGLRAYTLQHVLLHEVGHHVYWMQRRREGLTNNPSSRVKEQFAEDYALRHHCPW